MPYRPPLAAAGLLALVLTSACTISPRPVAAPASTAAGTCDQLDSEIRRAAIEQQDALDRQHDAWRLVMPLAVAMRHASAKSDAAKAGDRLDALRAEARSQGCNVQG